MNEGYPEAEPVEPSPVSYKDRSTGLIVFGILTLLLGCLSGFFVLLTVAGQALSAQTTNAPVSLLSLLPALCMYGVMAVTLIWLGIGSMMARRWARALLLILSWSWLALGIFEIVTMAFIMPKVLANLPSTGTANHSALPPGAMEGILFGTFLVLGVAFILLPAIWIYFYRSQNVKATCEARDPVPGWTDACPLPVLALCLLAVLSVPMMLVMPIACHYVAPFFGIFLTGAPAALFFVFLALLWGYSAWLLYHLDERGWWLILIAMCLGIASSVVTFASHDLMEFYRRMDYPEAQIEQIQKSGVLAGNNMIWIALGPLFPFLGYLLFIKKYFRRN